MHKTRGMILANPAHDVTTLCIDSRKSEKFRVTNFVFDSMDSEMFP